jgi:hypothetical protein
VLWREAGSSRTIGFEMKLLAQTASLIQRRTPELLLVVMTISISLVCALTPGFTLLEEWESLDSTNNITLLLRGIHPVTGQGRNGPMLAYFPSEFIFYVTHHFFDLSLVNNLHLRYVVFMLAIAFSIYWMLGRFTTNRLQNMLAVGCVISTFTIQNVAFYATKTSSLCLFVIGIGIFKSKLNGVPTKKLLVICVGAIFLNYGAVANLGSFLAAWTFPFLGLLIWKHYGCRFIEYTKFTGLLIAIGIVSFLPGLQFWVRGNAIQSMESLKDEMVVGLTPRHVFEVFMGGGSQLQYESWKGINYFPFVISYQSGFFFLQLLLFVSILVAAFIVGLRLIRVGQCKHQKIDTKLGFWILVLSMIIMFAASSDPSSKVHTALYKSVPLLYAWRDPWARFSPIYIVLLFLGLILLLKRQENLPRELFGKQDISWLKSLPDVFSLCAAAFIVISLSGSIVSSFKSDSNLRALGRTVEDLPTSLNIERKLVEVSQLDTFFQERKFESPPCIFMPDMGIDFDRQITYQHLVSMILRNDIYAMWPAIPGDLAGSFNYDSQCGGFSGKETKDAYSAIVYFKVADDVGFRERFTDFNLKQQCVLFENEAFIVSKPTKICLLIDREVVP